MEDTPETFQRNTRIRFIHMMESGTHDLNNRSVFTAIVRAAVGSCELPIHGIAKKLEYDPATIWRWAQGQAFPKRLFNREVIVDILLAEMRAISHITEEETE